MRVVFPLILTLLTLIMFCGNVAVVAQGYITAIIPAFFWGIAVAYSGIWTIQRIKGIA